MSDPMDTPDGTFPTHCMCGEVTIKRGSTEHVDVVILRTYHRRFNPCYQEGIDEEDL